MLRNRLIGFALLAVVTTCTAMFAAPGQGRPPATPATPTDIARVKVANAGRADAVPVSIQELALPILQNGPPMKVELTGKPTVKVEVLDKPTVIIDPATTVSVKLVHATWELYKSIKIPNWDDASSMLNSEGAQGWETTGVMFSAPGGTTLVLKRQK